MSSYELKPNDETVSLAVIDDHGNRSQIEFDVMEGRDFIQRFTATFRGTNQYKSVMGEINDIAVEVSEISGRLQ